LFHEFQPMGGVNARFAEGELLSCATITVAKVKTNKKVVETTRPIFMQTFYQKRPGIGTKR
jgi:hypothetical protein